METQVKSRCLRYIVPFVTKDDFETACNNTDSFNGKITPKYATGYPERNYRWKRYNPNEPVGKGAKEHPESDLYDYIRKEFSMLGTVDDENKLGCTWNLIVDDWKQDGQNDIPYQLLWFESPFEENNRIMPNVYKFHFDNIGLFLFRNRLGFLWYEIEIEQNLLQVDNMILFQNAFRELNREKNIWIKTDQASPIYMKYKDINKSVAYDRIEEIWNKRNFQYITPFSMGNWVSEIIGNFLEVEYISSRMNALESIVSLQMKTGTEFVTPSPNWKNCLDLANIPSKVPDKAVLFTYAAFEPVKYGPDCMISDKNRDIVYHLTNGYKESYHYSPDIKGKMLQPFADALWYATKEGGSYIVWPSDHSDQEKKDGNTNFFNGNFLNKIEGDYFHLYIRCLYQSYSLLLYAEQTQSKLSALKNMYMEDDANDSEQVKEKREKNEKELENLCIDINLFLTKNMATSVSHIDHQSDFYIYLTNCLHIHSDIESVTAGLNALDTLQREQKEKEEHRREKEEDEQEAKRDSRFQAIMGLLSILTISSALVDWRTLAEPIISTEKFDNWVKSLLPVIDNVHFYQVSYLSIACLGMIGLIVTIRSFIKSFKRKSGRR